MCNTNFAYGIPSLFIENSFKRSIAVAGEQTNKHGVRMPRKEIAFTAQPKIHSHYQIFKYGRSIFCPTHRPNFLDIFDLCLH